MSSEQYEEIPWAQLLADDQQRRRRTRWITVAVLTILALLAVAAIRRSAAPEPAAAMPAPASTSAPSSTTSTTGTTTSLANTGMVVSEAALRATTTSVLVDEIVKLRAETFVADYFTVDGDPAVVAELEASLAAGVDLPQLPHDDPQRPAERMSFVERADAYSWYQIADDRWIVGVAFRTLYTTDGTTWTRSPVHAVAVGVVLDGAGGSGIVDLPMPIVEPLQRTTAQVEPYAGSPTGPASAVALDYARLVDADATIAELSGSDERWRAVVEITDRSGLTWPLSIRSDLLP